MIVAFVAGCGIWCVVTLWEPVGPEKAQNYSINFTAWETRDDDLVLTSPQMPEKFVINGYQKYMTNYEALIAGCDGRTTFSAWIDRIDPEDTDPYFRVYALSSGEMVYRTFADTTAYKREEIPLVGGVFGGMLALVLAFSAFIYAVGSNPKKFPKWVVYACFKQNAIDI
jgi:hypothetical protein